MGALRSPGELTETFTAAGLAARPRRVPLGRKFKHITQVKRSIESIAQRGYAVGYNLKGDAWGMLTLPIPISIEPLRPGALTVHAPVAQ